MAQMNPDFQYYVQMDGTWKNKDETCKIVLSKFQSVEMEYMQCSLSSSYSAIGMPPQVFMNQMLGFPSPMMGSNYKVHDDEEIRINIIKPEIYNDKIAVYSVEEAWYGKGILHVVIVKNNDKSKFEIELKKEDPGVNEETLKDDGIYLCSYGYTGPTGKFCPNCGKAIKINDEL